MTIQERIVSDVAMLQISGRVTVTDGTAIFDDALRRLVDGGRVKLILDLGGVPYIDSTALGIILRAHATVTRRGGALRLLHVGASVRHILELTRLSTVIDAFDSELEAIASLAVPPPEISRSL
jgi:anti-sigma B factor antagonist